MQLEIKLSIVDFGIDWKLLNNVGKRHPECNEESPNVGLYHSWSALSFFASVSEAIQTEFKLISVWIASLRSQRQHFSPFSKRVKLSIQDDASYFPLRFNYQTQDNK